MNRRDRLRAFQMRLDGKTWAEIGEALNYTGQGVAKDLAYVIRKGGPPPAEARGRNPIRARKKWRSDQ